MRLAAIAAVGLSVLGFFIYIMTRLASPQLELLYGGLDREAANGIIEKLTTAKVPYEIRQDGKEIWVAREKKDELRLRMADQISPGTGKILGYELFDKQDVLSTTSFQQNVNYVRALEGELARTIRSINRVRTARVHLVLPKRDMFAQAANDPSAAVVLGMQGARLEPGQVAAIQSLVAASVPQMRPSRISIVDERGTLLSKGGDEREMAAQGAEEMRLTKQAEQTRKIEEIMAQVLGPGRAHASVALEMDVSRTNTFEEIYDPEKTALASETSTTKSGKSNEGGDDNVSVTGALPDPKDNRASGTRASTSDSETSEVKNYQTSRMTRKVDREIGEIRRMTVSVMVDGLYDPPATPGGPKVYRDHTPEELTKLEGAIRAAVGFDSKRGDEISVVSMPFAGGEERFATDEASDMLFGMRRDFVERVASNLGLSVVAILFLLLVLRPLVGRAIDSMQGQVGADGRRLMTADGQSMPQLTGPGVGGVPGLSMGAEEEVLADELIDIDKVEGRVKASSIRKIGEIVEKHPEEALAIIRNWLYQDQQA